MWVSLYRFRQIPQNGAAHRDLKNTRFIIIPQGLDNLTNMAERLRTESTAGRQKKQGSFRAASLLAVKERDQLLQFFHKFIKALQRQ